MDPRWFCNWQRLEPEQHPGTSLTPSSSGSQQPRQEVQPAASPVQPAGHQDPPGKPPGYQQLEQQKQGLQASPLDPNSNESSTGMLPGHQQLEQQEPAPSLLQPGHHDSHSMPDGTSPASFTLGQSKMASSPPQPSAGLQTGKHKDERKSRFSVGRVIELTARIRISGLMLTC